MSITVQVATLTWQCCTGLIQTGIKQLPGVEGVPYVLPEMASDLYQFIIKEKPQNCLELDFVHDASSCYLAAWEAETGQIHREPFQPYSE